MVILLECGCESTYINKANIMKELKKLNNSTQVDFENSFDFIIFISLHLVKRLNGFYTGAIYDLSEAIIIDPNNCYALKCRAYCYYKLKLYEEALCDLNMVILLECGCESTYINKANIMKELKKLNNSTQVDFEVGRNLDTKGKKIINNINSI
ncbi:hypothetical protein Glove_60g38 [Diversispora epigaea]|uniref:Uncharacterized protein n=1 Tax=Diversispora epigaea TaxID=1348612 RepID=A0A397JMS0_9GLOM|nr:hypothetical protein Glove_60g38 [Diversispora epigaea]